jgi:pentatricopeptide repeat protein
MYNTLPQPITKVEKIVEGMRFYFNTVSCHATRRPTVALSSYYPRTRSLKKQRYLGRSRIGAVQQCKSKLRLYSSLFTAYCEAARIFDAIRVWNQLKGHEGLVLTERELWR